MKKAFFSFFTLTLCLSAALLLWSCEKDPGSAEPVGQPEGRYTGVAASSMGGDHPWLHPNAYVQFGKSADNAQLTILGSNLDIAQNKVMLMGNQLILPKQLMPGTQTYEEGTGTLQGNKLSFTYIRTTELATNGHTRTVQVKTVCNFTKNFS